MATRQSDLDGGKQVGLDLFAQQDGEEDTSFEAYHEWRESIAPPENPATAYASNEQWNTFVEEGVYRVDWDVISDRPKLMSAMYQYAREEAGGYDTRRTGERVIRHSEYTFHPAVLDIPVEIVEEALSLREKRSLKEEANDAIEHIKRGLIHTSVSGETIHNTHFTDWNDEKRRVQGKDHYLSRIDDIDLLTVLLDVVDSFEKTYSSTVRETYINAMYNKPHTPDSRSETLFSEFEQENIDSAISFAISGFFASGMYADPHVVRWQNFFNVLSDSEIENAVVNVFTESRDEPNEPQYNGQKVMPMERPHHFAEMDEFYTEVKDAKPHNVGMILSYVSDDTLCSIVEQVDEAGELSKDVLVGALAFGATHTGREQVYETYSDRSMFPENSSPVQIQFDANYERWKETFIDTWHKRGGTMVHTLMQAGARHLGANKEAGRDTVQLYADARPFASLTVSDTLRENIERLYNETQEYYSRYDDEKWRTVYRGVGGSDGEPYTPATVESWSEHKKEARKFVNDHRDILKREVQIPNVLATWESLGDAWPEMNVKGCKEWMVLGAGVRFPQD